MILNEEEIEYFKHNKHLITSELLDTLRNQGKDGRQIAIEILDLNQDSEKYYLDAFNNRIYYNGDRGIKKAFTSLPLSNIHFEEIEKCKNSIQYFMQNYVKIVTPKGVNFPDLREYQKEFIDILNKPENESIISLQSRQSGKSITIAIWICWAIIFEKNINIGICANKFSMAQEFIDKIRKIFYNLPIWMTPGCVVWNKQSLEFENRVKIMCDATSENSFRGFTMNYIVVDECVQWNSNITIRSKITNKIMNISMKDFYEMLMLKRRIIKIFKEKYPQVEDAKIKKYVTFCIENRENKIIKYETDRHHILPKADICFPEFKDESWNICLLSYKNHFIAHSLLADALPNVSSIIFAWNSMCNKVTPFRKDKDLKQTITPELYSKLRKQAIILLSDKNKNKVSAYDNVLNKNVYIQREEYHNHPERYSSPSKGLFTVKDKDGNKVRIKSSEYNRDIYKTHTTSKAIFLNLKTNKVEWIDIKNKKPYHKHINTLVVTRNNFEIKRAKDLKQNEYLMDYNKFNEILNKYVKEVIQKIKKDIIEYRKNILNQFKTFMKEKYKKERTYIKTDKYYQFNNKRKNVVCARNVETGEKLWVSKDEFHNNEKLVGVTKGLTPVIEIKTGKIVRIIPETFNSKLHLKIMSKNEQYL